jgi:endonuclease/exonuclease/phosphatase family metal-dependent hydrolase
MAENLPTYFTSGRRLDWVLISDELEFLSHAVLPDAISDHQAIVADIGWKTNSDKAVSHFRNRPRCSP